MTRLLAIVLLLAGCDQYDYRPVSRCPRCEAWTDTVYLINQDGSFDIMCQDCRFRGPERRFDKTVRPVPHTGDSRHAND